VLVKFTLEYFTSNPAEPHLRFTTAWNGTCPIYWIHSFAWRGGRFDSSPSCYHKL